jgi:hypothetical protein
MQGIGHIKLENVPGNEKGHGKERDEISLTHLKICLWFYQVLKGF